MAYVERKPGAKFIFMAIIRSYNVAIKFHVSNRVFMEFKIDAHNSKEAKIVGDAVIWSIAEHYTRTMGWNGGKIKTIVTPYTPSIN